MGKLVRHLLALAGRQFWGDIHIRMQEGRITMLKVTQDYKGDAIPDPPADAIGAVDAQMRQLVRELKGNPLTM